MSVHELECETDCDWISASGVCTICVHENSEGLSSATNPKPKGLPSHCLFRQA